MIVPTINRTRILPRIGVGYRAFAMKIREEINPLPPNFSMDAIRPLRMASAPLKKLILTPWLWCVNP